MFDIAWTEILLIAVLAIIVVGPKELPGMLRAFGKTFGQVRRTAREFQSTFNDALREAERQANIDEVKKDIQSIRDLDPTKDVRDTLADTKASLSGKLDPDEDAFDSAVTEPDKPDAPVVPLKPDAAAQKPPANSDAEPAAPSGAQADDAPRRAAGADGR